jgi:hypothetical protein
MSFCRTTPTVCSDPTEFSTVLESTDDRKKEVHVIENLRYSVDDPDEAKCSQMTSL